MPELFVGMRGNRRMAFRSSNTALLDQVSVLWRRTQTFFGFAVIAFLLTACGGDTGNRSSIPTPGGYGVGGVDAPNEGDFVRPAHMEGREPVRVAMLLPLTGQNRAAQKVAKSILDAAQLAIFDASDRNLLLMPKDTMGTPDGAEAAARSAIKEGAEIILGPLFSESVVSVVPVAQAANIPIVAFSTDRNVSGPGTYLLSFLPEQEVERITDFAVLSGHTQFAAMIPSTLYGDRVLRSFHESVSQRYGSVVQTERYTQSVDAMFEPAKRLAQIKNYQAVLLPEGGTHLRGLAPLLPYFDVDPRKVKFLGTGLWDDPTIGREPTLIGGWFAAPPPASRKSFAERFESTYGRKPPRIASLGYDAVGLSAVLARQPQGYRFTNESLTNPNGFNGVDGIFRFHADGSTERGLAVIEVAEDGFKVVSPAPTTFEAATF